MKIVSFISLSTLSGFLFLTGCGKSEETVEAPENTPVEQQQVETINVNEIAQNVTQGLEVKANEMVENLKSQAGDELSKLTDQLKLNGDELLSSFGGDSTTSTLVKSVVSQALAGNESEALAKMKNVYQLGSTLLKPENLKSLNSFRDTLATLALKRYLSGSDSTGGLVDTAVSALGKANNDGNVLSSLNQLAAISSLSDQQSGLIGNLINVYKPSPVDEAKNAVEGISKGLSKFGIGQ